MAPETYYVQTAYGATYSPLVGAYLPIIYGLRNELTWIQPQLYNTGSVNGLDNKVYSSSTADFIVSMTEMLLQGFPVAGTSQTFPALREDQVAFGLPASASAAGSGYTSPTEVKKALNYLTKGTSYGGTYVLRKAAGYPGLRGIMTWSINWDKVNNSEFASNYYPYFFGNTGGNQAPVVSITSPAANATFNAPASVSITASASDADGTVAKVEFYNGTTLLGTSTSSPYTYSWTNVAAGSYSLTAKATDNAGAVTTSSTVAIVVNGTTSGNCAGIAAWSATAVYTNGMQAVYNSKLYTAKWWTQNEQPDTHTGDGQVWSYVADCGGGTNPGNVSPVVSITSPAASASFTAPASVTITASATDADGTIAKVDFYSASAKIGTATASPYSYTWTGVAAGTYSLTAIATDNAGATTTSGAVNITVTSNTGNTGNCAGVPAYAVYPAIYNVGDKVVYNGYLYQSLANSLYNVTPGTADWWWQPLGACSSARVASTANNLVDQSTAIQTLVVYPNPVTGSNLQVQVTAAAAEKIYVEIWSVNGNSPVLHKEYIAGAKGQQLISLDISRVPQGTFIIKTTNATGTRKGSAKMIRM
jgi:chitinase